MSRKTSTKKGIPHGDVILEAIDKNNLSIRDIANYIKEKTGKTVSTSILWNSIRLLDTQEGLGFELISDGPSKKLADWRSFATAWDAACELSSSIEK